MITVPSTPDAVSIPATGLPDVRSFSLGDQDDDQATANAVILKRVVQPEGKTIPVASFQSAL